MNLQIEKLTKQELERLRNELSNQPTGIPIPIALNAINNLPDELVILRCALKLYFQLGNRPCEIDELFYSNLRGQIISWLPRKRQVGRPRVGIISLCTVKDIETCRRLYKCSDRLLPCAYETIRRMFNEHRVLMGLTQKKEGQGVSPMDVYRYTLKSFRKLYSTKLFHKNRKKYNDNNTAILMTAKELRHSAKEITAIHYIVENAEELEILKYLDMEMYEIVNLFNQPKLTDFHKKQLEELKAELQQKSLSSY